MLRQGYLYLMKKKTLIDAAVSEKFPICAIVGGIIGYGV